MSLDDSPGLTSFKLRSSSSKAGRSDYAGNVALAQVGADLDGTLNFRVNSGLKAEFDKLCRTNHTSAARELKRFMTEAIRSQTLI